jgi:hypothetical protein
MFSVFTNEMICTKDHRVLTFLSHGLIDSRLHNQLIFVQHEMVVKRYRNLLTFLVHVTVMMINTMQWARVIMINIMQCSRSDDDKYNSEARVMMVNTMLCSRVSTETMRGVQPVRKLTAIYDKPKAHHRVHKSLTSVSYASSVLSLPSRPYLEY